MRGDRAGQKHRETYKEGEKWREGKENIEKGCTKRLQSRNERQASL